MIGDEIVRKIAENYKLPYYTISPTYSVCESCGYINGEVNTCPKCGKETEIYSRITGYYRPVKNWNAGKTEEFKQRKTYDLNKSKLNDKVDKLRGMDIIFVTTAETDEESKELLKLLGMPFNN